MATITVRDLDEDVKAKLRVRAAGNGRSMEAEVRSILEDAARPTGPTGGLGTRIHRLVMDATDGEGGDLPVPPRDDVARVADVGS